MNMYVYFAFILFAAASVELISLLILFFVRGAMPSRRRLAEGSVNVVCLAVGMTVGFQLASQIDSTSQKVLVGGVSVAVSFALGRLAIYYLNKAQQTAQTDRV